MVDLEISFCCLIIYLVEWDFFLFYSVVWILSGFGLWCLFSTDSCVGLFRLRNFLSELYDGGGFDTRRAYRDINRPYSFLDLRILLYTSL